MPRIKTSSTAHLANDIRTGAIDLTVKLNKLITRSNRRLLGPSQKDFEDLAKIVEQQNHLLFTIGYALDDVDKTLELRQLNFDSLKY